MLEGDYGFDEAFKVFDRIDNNRNNLDAYKPMTSKNINKHMNY